MSLQETRKARLRGGTARVLALVGLLCVLQYRLHSVFLLLARGVQSSRRLSCSSRVARAAEGKPLELQTLPDLDTYTLKQGVLPAPTLQLPNGKRSVFDGVPLRQVDDAAGASDVQASIGKFFDSLVGQVGPLDLATTALLLCALSLGLLDTRRRWIDYAAEEVGWAFYSRQPDAVALGRRVAGGARDVEVAWASWAETRKLAEFVESAKPADQLRALAAADTALAKAPELEPLVDAIRSAASKSVAIGDGPWPSLDGEWECLCDYYTNGELERVAMRIDGSVGSYEVGGGTHKLSDIVTRKKGSLLLVSFRWSNVGGGSGRGTWKFSGDGDCIDGTWRQDMSLDGPWIWTGVRRKLAEPSAMVGRAPPVRTAAGASAAAVAAAAAAEVVEAVTREPPASREAMACAWDAAAPKRIGGTFSQSAVLPRLWLAAGAELRTLLGLTYDELVPPSVSALATGLTFAVFALVAVITARVLAVGLGSSSDAATWASFAASAAVVLDLTVPARRESIRDDLRSPEQQEARSRRLEALCRWADSGALLRSGSAPRDEVIEAVRRGVPEFRAALDGDGGEDGPLDGEIERMLRIWHPALKRRVLRGLAGVQAREQQQEKQESPDIVPAVITYENLSVAESAQRTIWR